VGAEDAAQSAEKAAEKARRQKRDEMICRLHDNSEEMTQQDVVDALGLSRSRIGHILAEFDN